MEHGLVVVFLVAVVPFGLGEPLGHDRAVRDLHGRDDDLLVLEAGHAAQLEVSLPDALVILEGEVLADAAAGLVDHLEIVQDLLALIDEGRALLLLATAVHEHGGDFQDGLRMEVAVRVDDGQVHGNLLAHERQDFRIALDLDVLGQLHLLGAGFGACGGRDDCGAQEENFKDILHFQIRFYCT